MSETLIIQPAAFSRQPQLERQGDVTILIHPDTGIGYKLNETAVAVWEAVQQPITVADLRARFDVAPDEAEAFARKLHELGLVDIHDPADPAATVRRRYLQLLKKALVNLIYPEHELRLFHLEQHALGGDHVANARLLRDLRYSDATTFEEIVRTKRDGTNFRKTVTRYSHTMVGLRRLDNLEWCAEQLFAAGTEGDFCEAGACQGGASIFMRALQVAYGEEQRAMWVADSFQGLPVPTAEQDQGLDFSESRLPWLAASLQAVQDNFRTYDLLSDEVHFVEGWFNQSLPNAAIGPLALLRVDADLYESTTDVLTALYDKVVPGGFIVVDDYHAFRACRQAVDEFRAARGISDPLRRIDWTAIYWQKS